MKKYLIGAVVAFGFAALLITAGVVYAQTQVPTTPWGENWGMGGMMGNFNSGEGPWNHMQGRGIMGGYGMMGNGQYGPMHDAMVTAVAEELGISVDELNDAIGNGNSLRQVAEEQGLGAEEITTVMQEAHNTAIDQALAEGTITQEQAEWMNNHMQQMWDGNNSFGGHCNGRWQNQN